LCAKYKSNVFQRVCKLSHLAANVNSEVHDYYCHCHFRSYGNFVPNPAGDISRLPGDVARPAGGGPRPAGGSQSPAGGLPSPAGDHHKYARLDHVYSKGLVTESPDATTDHRPVVTTVRAGGCCLGTSKLVPLKRRNFKAIRREELEGTLRLTEISRPP
jgi:hypothetical protein